MKIYTNHLGIAKINLKPGSYSWAINHPGFSPKSGGFMLPNENMNIPISLDPIEHLAPLGIYSGNPFYWKYNNQPTILLGGSREDNLYQYPDNKWITYGGSGNTLEGQLDKLVACGGNYIRGSMSCRNAGNHYPYLKTSGTPGNNLNTDTYDLNQWDPTWESKLSNFLSLCNSKGIIVQIEFFDRFDVSQSNLSIDMRGWDYHPWNPDRNSNYTSAASGLPGGTKSNSNDHELFYCVPDYDGHVNQPSQMDGGGIVLDTLIAYVDKILSYSMQYENIMYCIQNEFDWPFFEFGEYWVDYIQAKYNALSRTAYVTDMSNISDPEHTYQVNHRRQSKFRFYDYSQNNHNNNQAHYDNNISARSDIINNGASIKPINNVKIYGGTIHGTSVEEGKRRFFRSIFAGVSAVRFHRPGYDLSGYQYGIGLDEQAQQWIQSARMLESEINIPSCIPNNGLLSNRSSNEAYCLAEVGVQYAVYFPAFGSVTLNISGVSGDLSLKWLDIVNTSWGSTTIVSGSSVTLTTPANRQYIAVLKPTGEVPVYSGDEIETMLAVMAEHDEPDAVADISNPDYFVSPHGSDTNNGLSASTPWKTLTKVNSINYSPGTVIAFERGGEYYGFIDLGETKTTTGTEANRVVFTAYGTGAKPVIHGWKTLSGWTDESGGKWSVTDSDLQSTIGMLILNNARREKGRYPKKGDSTGIYHNGWHPLTGTSGNWTIYSDLPDNPNFLGGEIVINRAQWLIEVALITVHSGNTISFSGTSMQAELDNDLGFYVQNHINCLTTVGDWMYDGNAKKLTMFFGAENPANHQVRVSSIDYNLNVNGGGGNPKKFITFNNLGFQGSSRWGAHLTSHQTEGVRFEGCECKFAGGFGTRVYQRDPAGTWRGNPKDTVIDNCLFEDMASGGVEATHINGITVTNNVVRRSYLDAGSNRGQPIHVGNTDHNTGVKTIEGNRVYNCGSHGIRAIGSNVYVNKNIVYHFCETHPDQAGIYIRGDKYTDGNWYTNRNVTSNIVCLRSGWTTPLLKYTFTVGVYHDDACRNVTTTDNVMMNCSCYTMCHGASYITILRNLGYNSYARSFVHSDWGGRKATALDIQQNVIYGWVDAALSFRYVSGGVNTDITEYGTFNNNYYINPGGTTVFAQTRVDWGTRTNYTFSEFKANFSPMEANSVLSPTESTASAVYVNPYRTGNLVVNIGTGKIDKDGNALASEQTLAPFEYLLVLG